MRSKYAMINLIKNKLRAAGQRDPMVMAVDACEETVDEGMVGVKNVVKGVVKATKAAGGAAKKGGKILGDGAGKAGVAASGVAGAAAGMAVGDKMSKPAKPAMNSEPQKPAKPAKPAMNSEPQKPAKPAKKYNPYGSGTANPSNMSGSTGP